MKNKQVSFSHARNRMLDDKLKFEKDFLTPEFMDQFPKELIKAGDALPRRLNVDPKRADHGLAKLVLTLIKFLQRLMEKQAIRRMEANSLTETEIERMGITFKKLDEKMDELKEIFGFTDEDLNLDLGPLGELM